MLIGLFSIAGVSPRAEVVDRLAATIDAEIASVPLHGAHLGVLVSALPSNRVLYAHHADDAFTPASTLKLLTGLTALEVFGEDARFLTNVTLFGTLRGARFTGEIVLRTEGDPTFGRDQLTEAEDAVAQLGIREIDGAIRVQSRIQGGSPYPPGWLWDDLPYAYAAVPSGIALDENALEIQLSPAVLSGKAVAVTLSPRDRAALAVAGWSFQNTAVTGGARTENTLQPTWGPAAIGVAGSMPQHASATTLRIALPDPALYERALLIADLAARGIKLSPMSIVAANLPRQVIWSHASPPLAELLGHMWQESDNFEAEMLLEQIGAITQSGSATRGQGLQYERALLGRLGGIDTESIVLADGSGLSRYNLATPLMFARLLETAWVSKERDLLLASLPLAGERGTLLHAFVGTPVSGAYYAKTGSMENVANLTGFLHSRSRGWLTVTIMADDAPISDEALHTLQTAILTTLVQ